MVKPLIAILRIGFLILMGQSVAAGAAEIRLIVGNPLRAVVEELGPQFERDTGHKIITKTVGSLQVKREIEAGELFDVAISSTPVVESMIKDGQVIADTRVFFVYARLGVGVRAGTPKPDIRSVEAFKRTLLSAKSVAHSAEGASSAHVKIILDRLGIADEMKPKLRPMSDDGRLRGIASGEAEMVIVSIPTIVAASGVELAGPLPSEMQTSISAAAGVVSTARDKETAQAVIRYFTGPNATAIIKAKGWEVGAP